MLFATTNTRVAIAQVRMHWTLEENLSSIYDAMHLAQAEGADICAFSELAITGYHSKIASLAKPELIDPAVAEIKNLSAKLKLAVALGAPTFDAAGLRYISHHLIDETGNISATVSKIGLTDPEATFFARGNGRPTGWMRGLR